ncbi:hypothetical protein BDZ88DRAFT_451557 [Geranomyces variabilis]|nr:hypothetical protein BDZ88DRAFT_451557 [Geranomyces variabilis]KAJ3134635.1 hypothetical protein HDU90_004967 [Geranomyces variabilis]
MASGTASDRRVSDIYGLPPPACLRLAREPYKANNVGELDMDAGDAVWVLEEYDNGWTKVLNATTNESGLVPDRILAGPKN